MDHQFTNSQQFIVIIKGIIWDPKEFFLRVTNYNENGIFENFL